MPFPKTQNHISHVDNSPGFTGHWKLDLVGRGVRAEMLDGVSSMAVNAKHKGGILGYTFGNSWLNCRVILSDINGVILLVAISCFNKNKMLFILNSYLYMFIVFQFK